MHTPDARIAPYLAAMKADTNTAAPSTAHVALLAAYKTHGRQTIDALLAAHWQRDPNYCAACKTSFGFAIADDDLRRCRNCGMH